MAINFGSALDALHKKEAFAQNLSNQPAQKLSNISDVPKKEAAQEVMCLKNEQSTFDEIVANTVELWHVGAATRAAI